MKSKLFLIIFLLSGLDNQAQSIQELETIHTKAKMQYVKPEVLDGLVSALKRYENDYAPGQDTLIMESYRIIVSAYMDNNHFKQSYETFNRYLEYKEKVLSQDKVVTINDAISSAGIRQEKDDLEEKDLSSQLTTLIDQNNELDSKHKNFKRNFSFILVSLSAVFAILLVSGGISLLRQRSELQKNKQRMKVIHRRAVTGNLEEGLNLSMIGGLKDAELHSKQLLEMLKMHEEVFPPAKQASDLLASIDKKIKDLIKKI